MTLRLKILCIILLISMFAAICVYGIKTQNSYEVLKVNNYAEFYVDLNKNKIPDENEHFVLYDAMFENDELSFLDSVYLKYLADIYAQKVLTRISLSKTQDGQTRYILQDGSDYKDNLKKLGYFFDGKNESLLKKNIEYAKTLDLVAYNPYSNKVHKLDCKFAFKSKNTKILKRSELKNDIKLCKLCNIKYDGKKYSKHKPYKSKYYFPRDVVEKYTPVYKDKYIEFYVTDFIKNNYPSSKCLSTACQSLLSGINKAKSTIDFAIYGIDNQPEITNALLRAQKRGVKVRWVYDMNKSGKTIYSECLKLKTSLLDSRSDIEYVLSSAGSQSAPKDAIMHNKFFIFDSQYVWTGSANVSHTDLSGFNANSAIFINSPEIAQIYKTEFEQMFKGRFHNLKAPTLKNKTILGASSVEVRFSPQDKIVMNDIIPLINNSKKYVYVPVFVITHKAFNNALIEAKKRGVDVKVIVDATSAGAKYSSVKMLRENKILVKTENRAGKMHMKSIIIDDEYAIIGSMNFTNSGERYNDENVLIIKNPELAKAFKTKFLYFWNAIPDKWLYKNPGAESFNSVNSCYDGIDNDFDGKVDKADEGCVYKKKTH